LSDVLKIALIALGGAVGAVLRYALSGAVQSATQGAGSGGVAIFPVGTLVVNVLGCVAIGALAAVFAGQVTIREEYRIAILVGVLGGFTTFSTYMWETFSMASEGQRGWALLNVGLSTVLGFGGAWLAYRVVEWMYGGPSA